MSKEYLTHWILGVICTLVWFWGDRAGIPPAAVTLASVTVPGLLAHALGASSQRGATSDPLPTTPQEPQQ